MSDGSTFNGARGVTVSRTPKDAKGAQSPHPGPSKTHSVNASSLGPQPVKNVTVKIDREKIRKAAES